MFQGLGSSFWGEDLVLQKGSLIPELENFEAGALWLTNMMKGCWEYRNQVFTFFTLPGTLLCVSWAFSECGKYHFKALLFSVMGDCFIEPVCYTLRNKYYLFYS